MKKQIIDFLRTSVKNNFVWKMMKPVAKTFYGVYLMKENDAFNDKIIEFKSEFKDMTVRMGPFTGLKYPHFKSICSALLPKLLGTYEMELFDVFHKVQKNNYDLIVDIGCAEGYYAVGLGLTNNCNNIQAYDIDPEARALCLSMAQLNEVDHKVSINGAIDNELLTKVVSGKRAFILSDCEGYEQQLFTKSSMVALKNCDILIETHDFYDINISHNLQKVISETHNVTSITSIDDIQKALTYHIPGLENRSLEEKYYLFAEKRPNIMTWLFCEPK